MVCCLAGSMAVTTRVTRRLQETPAPDKLSTSEYFQQIFETPGKPKAKVQPCCTVGSRMRKDLNVANITKKSCNCEYG